MGDEYRINFRSSETFSLEELEHKLSGLGCYAREALGAKSVAFRWTDKARRPDWPEDFTISEEGTGLLVNVHSGSRQEIARILHDVQAVLKEIGIAVISHDEE